MSRQHPQGRQRVIAYWLLGFALTFLYIAIVDITWHSNAQFHTLLETIATFLALMVGVVALVRYYSQPSNLLLFIGTGFLGTALLDGYHTIATSSWLAPLAPSLPSSLIPWSWVAARLFLAVMLYAGFLAQQREQRLGEAGQINEKFVYWGSALFTLSCFLFFTMVPLPQPNWPQWHYMHRPQEMLAAMFFLLALIGYLRDGSWRTQALEHWLVLALIVSVLGQILFMPASHELFDLKFDLAHFLKKISYVCVLTGLLINMLFLYRQAVLTPALQSEIIERKQAQQALTKSQTLLQEAQSFACLGNWELDPMTMRAFWSDKIFHIFGIGHRTEVGLEQLSGLLHPDDRETVLASLHQAANEGKLHHVQYRIVRPDGEIRWIECHGEPIYDEHQEHFTIRGFIQDITQRKLNELHLQEQERQVRDLLDSTAEAIFGVDRLGNCTFANPACLKMLGYQTNDMIGLNIHQLIHYQHSDGTTYPEDECPMHQTLHSGNKIHVDTEVLWRADGSSFPTEYWSHPILRDGELAGSVVTFLDISQRKEVEYELQQHRQHLEELVQKRTEQLQAARQRADVANEAKSRFLANMSHEIRTPMNAILGFTHLIQRSGLTAEQSERLTRIDAAANHLLSIINDILDISKIEAGKLKLEHTDFHLDAIFDHIQSLLQQQARNKSLTIKVEQNSVPLWLSGDPTRLSQAMLNFAGNAIKFTEQGTIYLRARKIEEVDNELLIRFEVQDSGIGITSDKLSDLFMAFEQGDASTTRKYGGTGLGLTITRHLAHLMGGEVGVESEPGQGSTFWFTARLGRGHGPQTSVISTEAMDSETELRTHHAGLHILLVEDNAINREVALQLLASVGLQADAAENGRDAVAKVSATAYDLVLMDLQMPEMDGLEATRTIRSMADKNDIPILAMTANVFAEDRQACREAGMDDFVSKPIIPQDLYSTLVNWLPEQEAAVAVTTGATSHPATGDNTALSNQLAAIKGMDAATGLDMLRGDAACYLRLLHQFDSNHIQDMQHLTADLEKGHLEAARGIAHTLKGAAGTLGLVQIQESAARLETHLRSCKDRSNNDKALRLLEKINAEQKNLHDALSRIVVNASPSQSSAVDADKVQQVLKHLGVLLAIDDTTANSLFLEYEALLKNAFGTAIDPLEQQIQDFDYPAAMATLESLASAKQKERPNNDS